jgi:hypothetical protein
LKRKIIRFNQGKSKKEKFKGYPAVSNQKQLPQIITTRNRITEEYEAEKKKKKKKRIQKNTTEGISGKEKEGKEGKEGKGTNYSGSIWQTTQHDDDQFARDENCHTKTHLGKMIPIVGRLA